MRAVKTLQDFLPTSPTQVTSDEARVRGAAPSTYTVRTLDGTEVCTISFQSQPFRDGINGVTTETLLAICLDRLFHFQIGKMGCRENDRAIENVEQALMWLRLRIDRRLSRGVYGTDVP